MASVEIFPSVSLIDEDILIVVRGLHPNRNYSFHLSLKHRNGTHESEVIFRANEHGIINLAKAVPIRGSYRDAEPMGLFMCMIPAAGYRYGSPIVAVPTSSPFVYKLRISDAGGQTVVEREIKRYFEHPNVERIEIENEVLTGTIYKPKDVTGTMPAIIDLYGSSGGIKEHRAALLASHGFAVLCLPYFAYRKLPDSLTEVDLDYFQNAIEFFCAQPYTTNRCGIIGTSLGGAIACLMSIRNPKVKAVVSVNCSPVLDVVAQMREHGRSLPVAPYEEIIEMRKKNGVPMYKSILEALSYDHTMVFPIEKSAKDTEFYFIASIDDDSNCSVTAARVLCERLRQSNHCRDIDVVWGGHLIDPSYMPLVDVIYNKFFDMFNSFGGEPWGSAVCQRHTWQKTIDFFSSNIGKPIEMGPISTYCSKL